MADQQGSQAAAAPITRHHFSPDTSASMPETPRPASNHAAANPPAPSPTPADPLQRLASGQCCFGKYEILEEIARGGMGIIYKARQIELNRLVALKVIQSGPEASEADIARFRAEAEVLARLDHPHIIPIYDAGVHDGWHYYSMKLIDGPNLGRRIGEYAADCRAAARLMVRIVRAVQHAHELGVVHRDLKPSNILIDAAGEPYLSDFGLALNWQLPPAKPAAGSQDLPADAARTDPSLGGGPESDPIVGTPSYMAPEQAAGKPGNGLPPVDVHSLGAIFFQMLTGRPPYRGETAVETLLKTVHNEPTRPRLINPAVDTDLEAVCMLCLRKSPTERYPSARALADDLERWLSGQRTWASRRLRELNVSHDRLSRRTGLLATCAITAAAALLVSWLTRTWLDSGKPSSPASATNGTPSGAPSRPDKPAGTQPQPPMIPIDHFTQAAASFDRSRLAVADAHRELVGRLSQLPPLYQKYVLYLADASVALAGGDADRGLRLLADCPDRFRGWEWQHLQNAAMRGVNTGEASTGIVVCRETKQMTAWAMSLCGCRIVWSNDAGEIIAWDLQKQAAQWKKAEMGLIWGLAFSPDGKRLAVAAEHGLRILDAGDGRMVAELKGHRGAVYHVAFRNDGRKLASAGQDRTVRLWDASTGEATALCGPYNHVPRAMGFCPADRFLAAAVDSCLYLLDAETGAEEERIFCVDGAVDRFAFSPDGRRLALTAGRYVRMLDAAQRRTQQTVDSEMERIRALAFSGDSQRLFISDGMAIQVVDPASGVVVLKLSDGKSKLASLPLGVASCGLYAAASDGEKGSTILLWPTGSKP